MPTYKVRDPKSGRTVTLRGDSPPSDADLDEIFASLPQQAAAAPKPAPQAPQMSPQHQAMQSLGAGMIGAAKGAASTAVNLGRLVHKIPGVSSAVDSLYGAFGADVDSAKDFGTKAPGLTDLITAPPGSAESRLGLNPTNNAQKVGFAAEQAAEYFAPAGIAMRGVKAAPLLSKAGPTLQRTIAEGASAVPVALAQGQSGEGATATGLLSAAMPGVAKVAGGVAKGITKFAFKPTQEALELNPRLLDDILEDNIGLSRAGEKKAQSLTDQAKTYAESLVDTHAAKPAHFQAGPQGTFRSNRVNVQGEIVDPVFTPQTNAAGHPNSLLHVQQGGRGFVKGPHQQTAANMAADVVADNPRELTLRQVLDLKRGEGRAAGEIWKGLSPENSMQKDLHSDLFTAADEALGRRIGPEWNAANKETQRRLTTQKVVEDAIGKSDAESHVPQTYDQYLLMRGVTSGDPVSVGIALAREAGRFRPAVAAAGRGINRSKNAPQRLVQAGRGLTADKNEPPAPAKPVSKAKVDSLYNRYRSDK